MPKSYLFAHIRSRISSRKPAHAGPLSGTAGCFDPEATIVLKRRHYSRGRHGESSQRGPAKTLTPSPLQLRSGQAAPTPGRGSSVPVCAARLGIFTVPCYNTPVAGPHRLVAQDNTLSRCRSRVRIPLGVPFRGLLVYRNSFALYRNSFAVLPEISSR